jgi:hypothetical protein
MKSLISSIIVGVVVFATPVPAQAEEIFICELTGDVEVPPVATPGEGFAIVVINDSKTEIGFFYAFNDITTNAVAAHIHFAPVGADGPIIYDLSAGLPAETGAYVMGTLTAADFTPGANMDSFRKSLEAMRRGNMYVNVHSAMHPGGELRGQLAKLNP